MMGNIVNIKIESYNGGLRCIEESIEDKQVLSIYPDGKIIWNRHYISYKNEEYSKQIERKIIKSSKAKFSEITASILQYIYSKPEPHIICDGGNWEVYIKTNDGRLVNYGGCLGEENEFLNNATKIIKSIAGKDAWAFG